MSTKNRKAIFSLTFLFFNTAISFAFLYLLMEVTGVGFVIDHYDQHGEMDIITVIWKVIYFSVITMAAVGYGDLTPIGYSQPLATLQAVIGYLFPIALVLLLAKE